MIEKKMPASAAEEQSMQGPSGVGAFFFVLLLGTFVAIAPVSTDIYLPALPNLEVDLHALPGSSTLTLSMWVLGVAAGQILAGPLMDRFGRRLPLAVGTLVYGFASVGCALAHTMPVLCAFRLIAAFFAAFSLVAPQACIRDVAKGNRGAELLSRMALVQGMVPLLAPAVGGVMLEYMSWRVMFWAMAAYGFFSASLVCFIPKNPPRAAFEEKVGLFASFLTSYQTVLRDRAYRYYGAIWMLQGIFVFAYLSAAPFIFERSFGLSPAQYGVLFGATAFVMISMTQLNALLLKKYSAVFLLRVSAFIGLCAIIAFLITACIAHQTLIHGSASARAFWFFPVAGTLLSSLCAFVMLGPNACACALYYQGKTAGSAASLAGSGVYLTGFFSSLLMGKAPQGTAVPLALVFLFAMGIQLFLALKAPILPRE